MALKELGIDIDDFIDYIRGSEIDSWTKAILDAYFDKIDTPNVTEYIVSDVKDKK